MKYYSRSGLYKCSNFSFDPSTNIAISYDWYLMTRSIGGYLVFNTYNYSSTTVQQKHKCQKLLHELGIAITHKIEAPRGLQDLDSALRYYKVKIENLEYEIAKPRTHKNKNQARLDQITAYKIKVGLVQSLIRAEDRKRRLVAGVA